MQKDKAIKFIEEYFNEDWKNLLLEYFQTKEFDDIFIEIIKTLKEEDKNKITPNVYSEEGDIDLHKILYVFKNVNPFDIKVVILGGIPYNKIHKASNQRIANGIAFGTSVEKYYPQDLKQIIKAIQQDFGMPITQSKFDNSLKFLSEQNVLLLNCCLTTILNSKDTPHLEIWKPFIKIILNRLSTLGSISFLLWGNETKEYLNIIEQEDNLIIESPHPMDYKKEKKTENDFINTEQFSMTNSFLYLKGKSPINWNL